MPPDTERTAGPLQRLRQMFLTGLIITLPLMITVWLLGILLGMVEAVSTPVLLWMLRIIHPAFAQGPVIATYFVPLVGVLLMTVLIMVIGALATNFIGRRLVDGFDRLMMRVPVVKGIYGAARQLLDAFGRKTGSFRQVVAVEYPRSGVWTIGFLTRSGVRLGRGLGEPLERMSLVFLPTTPNPTSGWLAVVPDASVVPLDMTIEDGVKLIVSGGLVPPGGPEARG